MTERELRELMRAVAARIEAEGGITVTEDVQPLSEVELRAMAVAVSLWLNDRAWRSVAAS